MNPSLTCLREIHREANGDQSHRQEREVEVKAVFQLLVKVVVHGPEVGPLVRGDPGQDLYPPEYVEADGDGIDDAPVDFIPGTRYVGKIIEE